MLYLKKHTAVWAIRQAGRQAVQLLSHVWLCNPMDCSTPGLPIHHQLPELAQTHAHWVSDPTQPSHPLSSPSPPALKSFPASGSFPMSQVFASGSQSIGASALASILSLNIQYWFPLGFTALILQFRGSQESSPISQFKSISSSELSLIYGPIFTSIHDYWKNHSFD